MFLENLAYQYDSTKYTKMQLFQAFPTKQKHKRMATCTNTISCMCTSHPLLFCTLSCMCQIFICSALLNFWYICQFCYFCLLVSLISPLLMSTAMMTAAASVVTAYMSFSMVMVMVITLNIRVKCQFSGNKCFHCRICISCYATI